MEQEEEEDEGKLESVVGSISNILVYRSNIRIETRKREKCVTIYFRSNDISTMLFYLKKKK